MDIDNQEVIDLRPLSYFVGMGKPTLGVALKMVNDYIDAHFNTKLIRKVYDV